MISAIQNLKLGAIAKDLGKIADPDMTSDEAIAIIETFEAKAAEIIPDAAERDAAINALYDSGLKIAENGNVSA